MRLISSELTWWQKRAFPAIWFAVLVLVTVLILAGALKGVMPPETLLIPLVVALFSYLVLNWLVFPLVDEVWIDGDDLVVRNRGEEDRFSIRHVVDVESSFLSNPEQIRLTVNPASRFGQTIWFLAPRRWFAFGWHPAIREVIDRSGCRERRRAARWR